MKLVKIYVLLLSTLVESLALAQTPGGVTGATLWLRSTSGTGTTNIGNTATFSVDRSAVLIGANTGKMCATAASNLEVPAALPSCAINSRLEREWRVTKTNFGESFNMDLTLNTCSNLGAVNINDLRLLVDDDGNFSNGGTNCFFIGDGTGITFSYTNPLLTISGIADAHMPNNATRFITIASVNPATPLPVHLISFDAILNESNTVDISWNTSSERKNDFFTIEKSTDGINWAFLSEVKGAGTTNVAQSYKLNDPNPSIGLNYYQLKQTDFNGITNDEGIRSIRLNSEEIYSLSPNPGDQRVSIYGENLNELELSVFNAMGQKINVPTSLKNDATLELDILALSNGIYYLTLSNDIKQHTLKLLIKH